MKIKQITSAQNSTYKQTVKYNNPREARKAGVFLVEGIRAVDEVLQAGVEGRLREVFGTGTAAVISPVGELKVGDNVLHIGDGKTGPLSKKLYDYLTDLQWGRIEDTHGWIVPVC